MASEKRLIDATPEHIRAVLEKVPYYPDEIWKFTAMTERFPAVDAVEVVRCKDCVCGKHPGSTMLVGKLVRCALYDPMPMMRCNDFCSYGERKDNGD